MMRAARVRISQSNLLHNAQLAKQLAPHSSLMAVVKADAYGHGAIDCCATLRDVADAFAVATVGEACALLDAHPDLPHLTVLHGANAIEELDFALERGLDLVLHDIEQLTLWEQTTRKPLRPLRLWLKINTGMNRLGVNPDQVLSACQRLVALGWSKAPIGLMTHLACADGRDDPSSTQDQLTRFDSIRQDLGESVGECSVAASAGILNYPESHFDWTRPGLMLYGISPTPGQGRELRPVMTFEAPLLSIRDCQTGDRIGYGATYTCPAPMRVGIIQAGYADGYPRAAGGQASTFVDNQLCRILGRVSMDLIAVDLSGTQAEVGDWVEMWGENVPVEGIAEGCDTIAYELLCAAGHSCRRI